jgi:hypothetical protein
LAGLLASAAMAQTPSEPAASDEAIVVEGQRPTERPPSVITQLRTIIAEADSDQLARFEMAVCPMVIGMPRDITAVLTRLIKENVVAVGGKVAEPGCSVNAAVIFIDNPLELVRALHKEEPSFFYTFTPREFYYFAEQPQPVFSWHLTNTYTRDGAYYSKVIRHASASRLYTNIREEMEAGIVVVDRAQTKGKTLRQLADFATMHLLLDVKPRAGRFDKSSILSLFEKRMKGSSPPPRFSRFDQAALTGFYTQRENNRTAAQQRQNIAAEVEKAKRAEKAGTAN